MSHQLSIESPADYRCPVCHHRGDPDWYLNCSAPHCPDGRDQPRNRILPRAEWPELRSVEMHERETHRSKWFWPIVIAVVAFAVFTSRARAMDHGFDPNSPTTKWFERLYRPDFPASKCCGKADAYEIETYWRNDKGVLFVKIGDGSAKEFPDGTRRPPIPDGTVIEVPEKKINSPDDDLDNPTDKSWAFFTVDEGRVSILYCVTLHPQGT